MKNSSIFALSALFYLALSTLAFASSAQAREPNEIFDCAGLREAKERLDPQIFQKCEDVRIQRMKMFVGDGRSDGIMGCYTASTEAKATGRNECAHYAAKVGLDPAGCKMIANFKTFDRDQCIYNSIYYLKPADSAFIGFTLDSYTQMKLWRESQERDMPLREVILEKLRRN